MPAYVIASIEVTNPDTYQAYSAQVEATLEPYGGRFLVRGGNLQPLEGGEWFDPRLVVIEFPSEEAVRSWYESDDYQRILPIRQQNSRGRLVIASGYVPPP
jgi:uncharacterized protein (DUF1330 family)